MQKRRKGKIQQLTKNPPPPAFFEPIMLITVSLSEKSVKQKHNKGKKRKKGTDLLHSRLGYIISEKNYVGLQNAILKPK
jgi:hypothetical protein